ncbi:MAG: glycerol-3-phosphate dehydrogenase/oxidase [Planctomycetes bacterium]|nr:glycerol-3-phosphate dehydrogenase/oxidase [Planctomycetota bacterium]
MKVVRIDDVSASIFARDRQIGGENRTFYSVTFSRSYKDSTGQWRYTKWFDVEDLGKVVAVAQQASEHIHGLLK